MTERKKRLEKSRTPQKFSIHLAKSNFEKISEIQEEFECSTRNEAINLVIDRFWLYVHYRDLLDALRRHYKIK